MRSVSGLGPWAAVAMMVVMVVVGAGVGVTPVSAQVDVQDDRSPFELFMQQQGASGADTLGGTPIDVNALILADTATFREALESFRAYYEYREHGFEHREQVFKWQFASSLFIFAMANALVLVGLYFSWLQFRAGGIVKASRASSGSREGPEATGDGTADGDAEPAAVHTIKISREGVTVSSPVLGVVILVLSLAFYYLYLAHVYPITEIW